MGETLKRRLGPLPVWAWFIIFVGLVAAYLIYRSKKAAATQTAAQGQNLSSNLGTVPVSNLTTAAQPMPIQLGDTFVNTTVPQSPPDGAWPIPGTRPPAWKIQPAPAPAPSPAATSVYSGEVEQGSGWWMQGSYAPIPGIGGGSYVNLESGSGPQSPAAVYGRTGTEYIQTSPGVFSQWTNPNVLPGTPLFAKVG
jgi:hypothetical protein